MIQVYCSGSIVADVQAKPLTQFLPADQVAIVDDIELIMGGNGANAAACLARVGVSAAVIGRIGGDFFGQFVRRELEAAGIDTRLMYTDPTAKTAATVAAIDPEGRRRCAHTPGATANFTAADFAWGAIEQNLTLRQSNEPVFLHFGSFFLMPGFDGPSTASVLQQAHRRGLQTTLDVCWDASGRWATDLLPCLPYCDFIFPNEAEARAITGRRQPEEMVQWFLDHGVKTAVVKLGPEGCLVKSAAEEVRVPGFVVDVVDATGAGDAFAGGFLAAQVWQWDLERTARFACALAAISVTDFGVTQVLRSKEQVLRLMGE